MSFREPRQPFIPKSMMIRKGLRVVCGLQEQLKPIAGVPEGKMRLRLRRDALAQLFVRTRDGLRTFLLEDRGDVWFARGDLIQSANIRRPHTIVYLPGADLKRCLHLNPFILSGKFA